MIYFLLAHHFPHASSPACPRGPRSPPAPAPGTGDTASILATQLRGDPAQTPAAPGLFLLPFFFVLQLSQGSAVDRCKGAALLSGPRGSCCVSFVCRGRSSFLAGPWMLVVPKMGMHRVLTSSGTSNGAAEEAVATTGIEADANSKCAHNYSRSRPTNNSQKGVQNYMTSLPKTPLPDGISSA